MPSIAYVRDQLFAGHLANWQSIVAGGAPLSGTPDIGLLDPLSLPYFILPLWLAPAFVVLLEFVVAIGGTFLFLRRLHLSRPASILAGIIFASSGFMVMWTNWPQTRVAALIPALFWAVERLVQRARAVDAVLVALVVASMLFGGFPQVTGFAVYLAAGYLLVRVLIKHQERLRASWREIGLAAAGLVGGLLLAMVQLLPFLYFYQHSDLSYRSGDGRIGLPLTGLITLISPNAYGLCIGGRPVHGPTNPVELVAYIGSAAAVLAVAGAAFGFSRSQRIGRGVRGYFVAVVAFIVVLVWISPSLRDVVAHVPVFSDSVLGRIRSVLGFALAVLAALGFDWLTLDRRDQGQKIRRSAASGVSRLWPVLVWGTVIVLAAVVLHRVRHDALVAGYWGDVARAIWIPTVIVVLVVAIVIASRLRPQTGRVFAFVVVPLLVAGQGAQFFHAVLPGDNVANFYPNTPAHQFLEANIGHDRFASSGLTMYPATALYYGLRTPTGHAFFEPAWQTLLTRVDPSVMYSPTFADFHPDINQTNIGNQPILDRMAVKYFVLPSADVTGEVQPLPVTNGSIDAGRGSATCTLPGQPLRGITVEVAQGSEGSTPSDGPTLHAIVRAGSTTIATGIYLNSGAAAGTHVLIPVAGEDLPPGGQMTVTIRATGAPGGLALGTVNGSVACAAVSPLDDGLKLVHADPGAVIYQRLTALPRIRWASRSVVITDPKARVDALARGVPADTVVLSAPGPTGSGRQGAVAVRSDTGDEISADVRSPGDGYLVIADAMQQTGWSVTVDGKKAKIVAADDAMAAVAVPAGSHQIEFRYRPPHQIAGLALTGVATIAILIVLGREVRRRRRSTLTRPRHAGDPPPRHLAGAARGGGVRARTRPLT